MLPVCVGVGHVLIAAIGVFTVRNVAPPLPTAVHRVAEQRSLQTNTHDPIRQRECWFKNYTT